ncbi:demethylmenaquinone methyltransferase [Kocuria sp. HSID16901]|uniref:demethylmenaquinone methyltransferase n=1 Tax=Kocuria sp. HSID16901 TaxID=2419505 RepID=UPI000A48823D|nr:demethylmenaquinone methyltransferase [Kocuria sp. HSID16901]MCT1367999.1 demethylmenaquinone methyltransferase [Rothia sp. p3-SID1597]
MDIVNRADLDKKSEEVSAMFDGVAPKYDLMNTLLSLGQDRGWRRATVEAVEPHEGQRILDVAAGTGASAVPYQKAGLDVVAADLSEGMLAEGRRRHPGIHFVRADVTDLPFDDEEFDAVTISFGIRNVAEYPQALRELHRVTKPGGRIVVCEFSNPTWPLFRRVYQEYLVKALPVAAGLFSSNPESYSYLAETIQSWPGQEAFAAAISDAGWQDVKYRNLTGGIVALHRGFKA